MHHLPVEALGRGTAEEEEHRIVEALLAGGDSRLLLDRRGVNTWLVRRYTIASVSPVRFRCSVFACLREADVIVTSTGAE